MTTRRFAAPLALGAALFCAAMVCATVPAHAQTPGEWAARRWKVGDKCVADATRQVPDHNEAALRKRDELVNACLAAHGLPPRLGQAPAPTPVPAPAPAPAAPAAPATPPN